MKETKVKNGKIELLRFVFSAVILLYHSFFVLGGGKANIGGVKVSPGAHGGMCVEFFFLLSGLLMAKSVRKQWLASRQPDENGERRRVSILKETALFLKKKIKPLLPYHIPAFFALLVIEFIFRIGSVKEGALLTVKMLPNLFFLQMTGLDFATSGVHNNINGIEWYISAMLVAMAVIYPFLRKWYNVVSKAAAPVALAILAYLYAVGGGQLTGVRVWNGFVYRGMLRGLAEVLLGIVAFEISEWIVRVCRDGKGRGLLTALEAVLYLAFLVYVNIDTFKGEFAALAMLFVALPITFSHLTAGSDRFDNKTCGYLGAVSLPIYMTQLIGINLSDYLLKGQATLVRVGAAVIFDIALAVAMYALVSAIQKRKQEKNA